MDEKTLMWGPHLLLVLSDGLNPSPALEQTTSAAPLRDTFLIFLVLAPFSAGDIFDMLKECVSLISCHTETENTDIISAPNKLGPSAELLS